MSNQCRKQRDHGVAQRELAELGVDNTNRLILKHKMLECKQSLSFRTLIKRQNQSLHVFLVDLRPS